MPLYEYECGACAHRFEIIQKFSDGPPDVCPKCGKGPLQRLQSSPAFQFKGTGWYVTDFKSSGNKPGTKAKDDSSASSDGETKSEGKVESKKESTSETAKAETKSETKSETKPAATASTGSSTAEK